MKKFLLLLIALPSMAFGQYFELGLDVGPGFMVDPSVNLSGYPSQFKTAFYSSMWLTMKLQHNLEIGLKIGGNALKSKYDDPYYKTVVYARSLNTISLFLNRRKKFRDLSIYGGLSVGFVGYKNPDLNSNTFEPEELWASTRGSGYMVGLQGGLSYPIGRRFDLNAELAFQYFHIKAEDAYYGPIYTYDISYKMIPLTIGAKYKFGIGKKYRMKKAKKSHD